MNHPRISRAVPLDQLRGPETDIREHRPEDSVKSLAASMGDPQVGQLQDVLVHPVDHDDLEDDLDKEALDELFREEHPMRIVDGETRRLAAKRLGWATLNATIVPEPPENTVIAQLDANTERIDMGEYETVRALYDHYQETDKTVEEVAQDVGYSRSYLSQVFGLMDSPDWLTGPWRHPDHPLTTTQALDVKSILSGKTIEKYQDAGNIPREEAREKAVEDAKLMIDVQAQHDLQAGQFRKRVQQCIKETLDSLRDQRSLEEKTADGQTSSANKRDGPPPKNPDQDKPCLICGQPHDRRKAVPVCRDDYGQLSSMEANGEVLMANADLEGQDDVGQLDSGDPRETAKTALSEWLGLPPDHFEPVLEELQSEAAKAQQGD